MRTIKFRLWDCDNESFSKIDFSDLEGTIEELDSFRSYFSGSYFVGENYLQQFTGLQDKNGVDIYEGDVLNYGTYTGNSELTGKSCNHVVKWDSEHGAFETLALYEKEATGSFLDDSGIIIGNIHESPELLNN